MRVVGSGSWITDIPFLINDEQNAVRRKKYFFLATINPETTRMSELNRVDS